MISGLAALGLKGLGLKSVILAAGRPVVGTFWPAIEASARVAAAASRPDSIELEEHDAWSEELDQILQDLPEPVGCSRDAYRQLCLPTPYRKRHLVFREAGETIALVSVRRRRNYWEPVSYQALPGFIAPARDNDALTRALRAAGIEINISAGLDQSVETLGPDVVYSYDVNSLDLRADYETHWEQDKRKHLNSVRKARRKCADFEIVVDGDDDLEWGLSAWRDMWADDKEEEVCAYQDRLRFWQAIRDERRDVETDIRLHTLSVRDGDRITSCVIFISRGKRLFWQCTSRDFEYNKFGVGTYALDAALQWAREQGFQSADLAGGGGFKAQWAPVSGKRYGAIYRPGPIRFFRKFNG